MDEWGEREEQRMDGWSLPAFSAETVKGHTPRSAMMASVQSLMPLQMAASSSGT